MSVLDNITKHVRRLGLTGSGQSTRKLDDAESRGPGSEMGNKVPGSPTEEVILFVGIGLILRNLGGL